MAAEQADLSELARFLAVFGEIVKYCDDYETLKTMQQTSRVMNALFSCPARSVWRQLCAHYRYSLLHSRPSRTMTRTSPFSWELVYYQNWRADRNWREGRFVLSALESGHEALHRRSLYNRTSTDIVVLSEMRPGRSLLQVLNGAATFVLSVSLAADGCVVLWDMRHGMQLDRRHVCGLVTSSLLFRNTLILGMNDGAVEFCGRSAATRRVKIHSAEVSALAIDAATGALISGDPQGHISMHTEQETRMIFRNESGGINGLLVRDGIIFAASVDGCILALDAGRASVSRASLAGGPINCVCCNENLFAGTDAGEVFVLDPGTLMATRHCVTASPITTMTCTSRRLAVGCFDGSIHVFGCDGQSLVRLFALHNHRGPIWSLGIDDTTLLSSSLDGTMLLRVFS